VRVDGLAARRLGTVLIHNLRLRLRDIRLVVSWLADSSIVVRLGAHARETDGPVRTARANSTAVPAVKRDIDAGATCWVELEADEASGGSAVAILVAD
jgi:hypothetical protein